MTSSLRAKKDNKSHAKTSALTSRCLAVVLRPRKQTTTTTTTTTADRSWDGAATYREFVAANCEAYWNAELVASATECDYRGHVTPSTVFVGGPDACLDALRNAWGRRVLKPPPGYNISSLGEVAGIDMQLVPQTQFVPLAEAICIIVAELNRYGGKATSSVIKKQLPAKFPGISIPTDEALFAALNNLLTEQKLCRSSDDGHLPKANFLYLDDLSCTIDKSDWQMVPENQKLHALLKCQHRMLPLCRVQSPFRLQLEFAFHHQIPTG
ncbi:PREDICTED: storkhead-box protein 1-like [Priapulus caudatus]|uniref:Storkhead-box protein 1-like n=1 Tax=Priapulus caudatus TaxID=37621 RepID=A0ABM1DSM4_PRICU|nr:PREDICTED: storkhead-box protein 1-like [Priapulus caudatus]